MSNAPINCMPHYPHTGGGGVSKGFTFKAIPYPPLGGDLKIKSPGFYSEKCGELTSFFYCSIFLVHVSDSTNSQ